MAEIASAYVSLLPSTRGFGKQVDSQIGGDLDSAGKKGGKRFGGAFKSVLGPAIGILSVGAVTGLLKGSIEEAREAQKVGAQTEAVIKSTGKAAGLSAKQFGELATSISLKTGIDDEQIQAGENMLATFTNIKDAAGKNNDIFSQATVLATDLGVATKTGPVQASQLLGKALNDPAKGLSRLTKIGVTFTDEQKKQVEQMTKAGDTAGAQRVILKELAKEFGGSAEAQATAGEKMGTAIGNLKEQIGTALLPVIDRLADIITAKVVPAISMAVEYLRANPQVLIAFGAAVGALALAFIAVQLAAFAIPLAIAAVVGGLVYAYTKFEGFRRVVDAVFAAVKVAVGVAMPYVRNIIKGVIDQILGIIKVFKGIFTGDWSLVWDGVKQILRGALKVVKAVLKAGLDGAVAILKGLGGLIKSAASAGFGKLKDGAQAGWEKTKNYVKSLPGKIVEGIGDLGGLLKDAGIKLISGLIDGIKSKFKDVKNTLGGLTGKLTSWKGPESLDKVILKPNGQMVVDGFISGLESRYPTVKATLGDLTSSMQSSVNVPAGARLDAPGSGIGGTADFMSSEQAERLIAAVQEAKSVQLNGRELGKVLTAHSQGARL